MQLNMIKKRIWKHQKKALIKIEEYLDNCNPENHCLVKMPTGAGKTGIMAIASNFYDSVNNILIVVPNAVLPHQMKCEIESEFWSNIGYEIDSDELKHISIFKKNRQFLEMEMNGNIIIITIQMLYNLFKEKNDYYKVINENIDLILYDEGHREPALNWSKICREMKKKMILFTATPFRNDDKDFLIDPRYSFRYSYKDAINDGIIRKIEFKNISINSTDKEISEVIDEIYESNQNNKLIVRCDEESLIEEIVNSINSRYKTPVALGCHSNFTNGNNLVNKGNMVLLKEGYDIYVHQNMLIEGINIPEISTLIILGDIKNGKAFIQQVGRCLRKGNGEARIYVPKNKYKYYKKQWMNFIKYDMDKCNRVYYQDGNFKLSFNLDDNFYKCLNIPFSGNIYYSEKSLYKKAQIALKDSVLQKTSLQNLKEYNDIEENIYVMCYEKENYSNLIVDKIYLEKTLECVVLKEVIFNNSYFYIYYDTRGYSFPMESFDDLLNNLSVDYLYNLFPENTIFNNVKLDSLNVNKIGINSRKIRGQGIENINTQINEKLSYCKNVSGRIKKDDENKINRYLGITTSKITDSKKGNLHKYSQWCEEIIRKICNASNPEFFNRFASVYIPNQDLEPSSILIDMSEIITNEKIVFYSSFDKNRLSSITSKIIDNNFYFNFNGNEQKGKIIKEKKYKNVRYRINNSEFKKILLEDENGKEYTLEKYINKKNMFKLFFSSEGVIYSGRHYFKSDLTFQNIELDSLKIGKKIIPLYGLDKCINEKIGSKPEKKEMRKWKDDSIFGFLTNLIKDETYEDFKFTDVVCDDLNYEIADFIALNTITERLVLIHCKSSNSIGTSASAFQDVCGQAQKNIHYLFKTNVEDLVSIKTHIKNWNGDWKKTKKYNEGKEEISWKCKRMIKGESTGEEFWDKYKDIISSPTSDLEVWLLTKSLSKNKLKEELKKEGQKIKENINQLFWILYGTQEVINNSGADLKIYCCE